MTKLREKLKELSPDFHDLLGANLVIAKSILDKTTPIEYTYHGFKHAETLEKFVDQLLPLSVINSLSADELFILLNGIYYHDIGMINYNRESIIELINKIDSKLAANLTDIAKTDSSIGESIERLTVSREDHNIASYNMIYDEENHTYYEGIINIPNRDVRYAKSIALLCKGHRDYKLDGNKISTIKQTPKVEPFPNGEVQTQFLACLVRLADELDITNQRAPYDIRIHLKNFINEYSLKQWLEHDLFSMVKIDNELFDIILVPNIDQIRQLDKKNQDRRIVRRPIFSKRKKISLELKGINEIFNDPTAKYKLGYKDILVKYDSSLITESDFDTYQNDVERSKREATLQVENEVNPDKAIDFDSPKAIKTYTTENSEVEILKEKTNKQIDDFHKTGKMLSLGNFILPSGAFSRYYINTNLFLPINITLNTISDLFYELYKDEEIDCIIGIDKAGLIIAPNLSLKLKCNYTYLVHKNDEEISVVFEKGCSITKAKKIVVITDVISTGKTVAQSMEVIKERFSPSKLFLGCVFCTNKTAFNDMPTEYNTFFVNDKFLFNTYSEAEINSKEELKNEFNMLKSIKK